MRTILAIAPLLLLAACVPDKGPMMAPGDDCLRCHGGGEAKRWTAAGTWSRGARVTITDANGKSFTLRGNDVGNFYTAESLAFPLSVSVDGKPMPEPVPYGGCNLCHRGGEVTPTTDEFMLPGADCLICHDGARAPRWTVAGTWKNEGAIVRVTDSSRPPVTITLVTNRVGNFFTDAPLQFPLTAWVDDDDMPDPVTYGGCNSCHPGGEDADDD